MQKGGSTVARNVWQDLSRLTRRVDGHDIEIADLHAMTAADHELIVLQEEGLALLGKLAQNNTRRLTRVEQIVTRVRRRIAGRRR